MTAERLKDFIKSLFSPDGVSSKRLLAFYFSLIVAFLMFFNFPIEVINSTFILIASLLGLTTIEKFKS